MNDAARYFLAIVPPEPVLSQVLSLKKEACRQFNSCAALKSPSHITLHMPFLWKEKKIDQLLGALSAFSTGIHYVDIRLNKIGHFGNRVIFLDPEANEDLLMLQSMLVKTVRLKLKLLNAEYKDRAYQPHMTIAFRDLKKQVFDEAYEYFTQKKLSFRFQAKDFALLRHDGKQWHDYKRFGFQ